MPRPFSLLIKPAGPDCNLACRYCFYACKDALFGVGRHRMSPAVLERIVSDFMALRMPVSSFAWQGGEPTLMGLPFYQQVVALQKKYGVDGQQVSNALQTNGILLDDEWCAFLAEYHFLVGISLDGPEALHDHYRRDCGGAGTWGRVMRAIEHCRAGEVEFNILVLLNDHNVQYPDELWDFCVGEGFDYVQFIPCVERNADNPGAAAAFSVAAEDYGRFMCRIFDRWLAHGPEKISVRLFDSVLNYYATGRHSNCTFAERCNDYIVIEHNGDAFCCDFFVSDEWRLGNIMETNVAALFNSERKRQFAGQKRRLANQCSICRHAAICRGGCLKDRIALTDDYQAPSQLCAGYRRFFDYAGEQLRQIAGQVLSAQPAVAQADRARPDQPTRRKPRSARKKP